MDITAESYSEEIRLLFDENLRVATGLSNIYYDPPESMFMEYPAIVYKKTRMPSTYADNVKYIKRMAYEVSIIAEDPDTKYVDIIRDFKFSSFDRHYIADDLHHDVFTIIF